MHFDYRSAGAPSGSSSPTALPYDIQHATSCKQSSPLVNCMVMCSTMLPAYLICIIAVWSFQGRRAIISGCITSSWISSGLLFLAVSAISTRKELENNSAKTFWLADYLKQAVREVTRVFRSVGELEKTQKRRWKLEYTRIWWLKCISSVWYHYLIILSHQFLVCRHPQEMWCFQRQMIASGFQKSTTIQEHEVGFMKFTMIEHVQLPRKYLREKSVLPHYLRDVSADTQIFTESRIKLKDQSISRPPSVHTACRRHANAMYRIVVRTTSHIKNQTRKHHHIHPFRHIQIVIQSKTSPIRVRSQRSFRYKRKYPG